MKKIIAVSLVLLTIVICGWLMVRLLRSLDIPSNKNDGYAAWEKRTIAERTDIDDCEKRVLQNQIDLRREHEKGISVVAFRTQVVVFVVLIMQLVLLVVMLMMKKVG